jgi:hypothetical protein
MECKSKMILRELPETNIPHNKISKNKNQKICVKCKITNILMDCLKQTYQKIEIQKSNL